MCDINSVHFEQLLDPIKESIFSKTKLANNSIFSSELQTSFQGKFGAPHLHRTYIARIVWDINLVHFEKLLDPIKTL